MCARWRSTAATAAAVTASTIWFKGGVGSASEAFTVLEIGAREGRRCVARGLHIRGGNEGMSPSSFAALNIMVLAVGLVQSFGGAGRSRCPSQRRWPVSISLGRWRALHGGADRWWWRSHLLKTPSDLPRSWGGCRRAIVRRRWCHKPFPGGHGGAGSCLQPDR